MSDVFSIGRVTVDFIAEHENVPLEDVTSFLKYPGGSSGNYAIACSRLSLDTAMISRVGKDAFGTYLLDRLSKEGVSTEYIAEDSKHKTAISFVALFPPDDFPILYYRDLCADSFLAIEDLPVDAFAGTKVLFASGTTLRHSPAREAMLAAMQHAHGSRTTVILDVDYRKYLWPTPGHLGLEIRAAANAASIIVGNESEIALAGGAEDPIAAAQNLLSAGVPQVVLKRGSRGALVLSQDETSEVLPYSVPVVNGLGAGDGFAAGVTFGLIHDWSLADGVRLGNVIGAIVVGRHSCADAMPYPREVAAFLANRTEPEARILLDKFQSALRERGVEIA